MLARCTRCLKKQTVKKLKGYCAAGCGGWNSMYRIPVAGEKERVKRVAAKKGKLNAKHEYA